MLVLEFVFLFILSMLSCSSKCLLLELCWLIFNNFGCFKDKSDLLNNSSR